MDEKWYKVAALDLKSVRKKFVVKKGLWWCMRRDAGLVEREYRQFLYLIICNPGQTVVPWSHDLDDFWHEHILDTAKYAEDCNTIMGSFRARAILGLLGGIGTTLTKHLLRPCGSMPVAYAANDPERAEAKTHSRGGIVGIVTAKPMQAVCEEVAKWTRASTTSQYDFVSNHGWRTKMRRVFCSTLVVTADTDAATATAIAGGLRWSTNKAPHGFAGASLRNGAAGNPSAL